MGVMQEEKPPLDSMAETLRSLDEAIGEFHRIKDNVQWVSAGEWPAQRAETLEQVKEEELSRV